MRTVDDEAVWTALREIKDPELGVDIVGLGMVEGVQCAGRDVQVVFRESYTACIAVAVIKSSIVAALERLGASGTVLRGGRWTGDAVSERAKGELAGLGIAIDQGSDKIVCPYCASGDVVMDSAFGSAPCRSAYSCRNCDSPFDVMRSAEIRVARSRPAQGHRP